RRRAYGTRLVCAGRCGRSARPCLGGIPASFQNTGCCIIQEFRQIYFLLLDQGLTTSHKLWPKLALKNASSAPTGFHLWTPPFRQGKTLGSLLRVVGCCHLSGL